MSYKVVSLFSGCGGLDLGFKKAGFQIIFANDIDKDAVETYKQNIGNHIILGDITRTDKKELPTQFDVLLAGFPCQGFSINNLKRDLADERNFLYREVLRATNLGQPKIVVMENVKGILSLAQGRVIKLIEQDFNKIGYNFQYQLINSADFGIPQTRYRVIMVASKKGIKFNFPSETHNHQYPNLLQQGKHVSVREAIGYLSSLNMSYKPIKFKNKTIYNHIASTNVADKFWARKHLVKQEDICDYLKLWRVKVGISVKKIDKIFGYRHTAGHWFRKDNNSGSIPNPDDWKRLKQILKFDHTYDQQVSTLELKPIKFEQSLRINNWETPSDTITATTPEIHPNKKRRLSARECAIIQSFPDDFIFSGSLNSMYRQIGNAVPVELGNLIAKQVSIAL